MRRTRRTAAASIASSNQMSNNTHVYDVFISYTFDDDKIVTIIVDWLKTNGIKPWFAKDRLPGEVFSPEIKKALETSLCVAVFVGKRTGDTQISEVLSASTPLIPVYLPGVTQPPFELLGRLARLTHVHLATANPEDSGLQGLLDAITEHCQSMESHAFAIEIEVPEAEHSCFVAVGDSGSPTLLSAAREAIQELGKSNELSVPDKTTEWKSSEKLRGSETDFVTALRESEFVVADCIFETGHACLISPEIAYQVGMAHALGKPRVSPG